MFLWLCKMMFFFWELHTQIFRGDFHNPYSLHANFSKKERKKDKQNKCTKMF